MFSIEKLLEYTQDRIYIHLYANEAEKNNFGEG